MASVQTVQKGYPLSPDAYELLEEVGRGVSAAVSLAASCISIQSAPSPEFQLILGMEGKMQDHRESCCYQAAGLGKPQLHSGAYIYSSSL